MKSPRYLIFLYYRVFPIPSNPKGATLFSILFLKSQIAPLLQYGRLSVKREYQQDATIQMFIVNFRPLLSTTVSTCFGHHYAHHQENKDLMMGIMMPETC